MILLELFWAFVKIGFTSFGGMSMIPLILEEMRVHNWMTSEDMTNLIAIAEMTPGPLGVNCATFAGTRSAGLAGGIVAVLGVLVPAFTLTLTAAVFLKKFRESRLLKKVMLVVKPICIAMILGAIFTLSRQNYLAEGQPDLFAVCIGLLAFFLLKKLKWSVPQVILSSAALGVLCYGVF